MIREPASPKIVSLRLSLLGRRWGLRTAKNLPIETVITHF
jgi:hypothetical protein